MHGLAVYYKKFIQNFSQSTKPLREALAECYKSGTNRLKWTEERQESLNQNRNSLANEPTLKLPVFDRAFQVETDASNYGCGGVLTQQHGDQWHPVAYFSKSLTPR